MDYDKINKLYKRSKLNTHYEGGLLIPLNHNWKKIAINLSGGADSASLALTLSKIIEENNYRCKIDVITYIREWKTKPWAVPISVDVYNWLKNRFPGIINERHVTYIPPELEIVEIGPVNGRAANSTIGNSFSQYLQYHKNFDAIYNATTKNPPKISHPDKIKERNDPKIDPSTLFFKAPHGWVLTPLMLTSKDWVIKQYVRHNSIDLLNTTRSCEGYSGDYTSYIHGESSLRECGTCYWCVERAWAKKEAGINEHRRS